MKHGMSLPTLQNIYQVFCLRHKQASADIPKELWLSIGQYQIKMVLGIIYGGCLGVSFWKVTHKLRLKGFRGTTL